MTLQGILQAEEYGSAASYLSGMNLIMSVWQESIGTAARSWVSSTPQFIGLPRVIVQSALQETSLHPSIHAIPQLQSILNTHQRVWDRFREEDIKWLLHHADLIGAIQSDPTAQLIWSEWYQRLNYSEAALARARAGICIIRAMDVAACDRSTADVKRYSSQMLAAAGAIEQWNRILSMDRRLSVDEWWAATHNVSDASYFHTFAQSLARLHDITKPTDPRLTRIMADIPNRSIMLAAGDNPWMVSVLSSLLTGQMWSSCLEHVRLREGRVRELMVVAGVQDLIHAHERILNASLRVVSTSDERRKVHDWFGEMSGYGWWMSESLPTLVRRCISQEAGDCRRLGPTEIIALTERVAERSKIVVDWTRRLLIGMWNALPMIGILFIFELILMYMGGRSRPNQDQIPQTFVLKLDAPSKQMIVTEG